MNVIASVVKQMFVAKNGRSRNLRISLKTNGNASNASDLKLKDFFFARLKLKQAIIVVLLVIQSR